MKRILLILMLLFPLPCAGQQLIKINQITNPHAWQFSGQQVDASLPNGSTFITDGSSSGFPAGTFVFKDLTGTYHPMSVDTTIPDTNSFVSGVVLAGTSLNFTSSTGAFNGSLDLSLLQDGTGTDSQTLTFTQPNLSITGGNSVDLSLLSDGTGTDDQQLTLAGTTLSLEDGGSVDLSSLPDIDNQLLTLNGNTLAISKASTPIDLTPYLPLTEAQIDAFANNNGYLISEVDGSVTNEIQDISLSGSNLSIQSGSTIDLSVIDNDTQLTEAQVDTFVNNNGFLSSEVDGDISNERISDISLSLTGALLSIDIEEGATTASQTIDLSNVSTDDQILTLSLIHI